MSAATTMERRQLLDQLTSKIHGIGSAIIDETLAIIELFISDNTNSTKLLQK